jgi:uncharacterized repeat protein (TIGR01451 family)
MTDCAHRTARAGPSKVATSLAATVTTVLFGPITPAAADTVTAQVPISSAPSSVAVNPVTNTIYVANGGSANVTVIDGATNATATVIAGNAPQAVAVNPVTNKIYVTNDTARTDTVIDGATNTTATVTAGASPHAVAVNPVTNKIYVANRAGGTITVIDGATNTTVTVIDGATTPQALAVNPVTNKIYVANQSAAGTVLVITEAATQDVPLKVAIAPLPGNRTIVTPTFSFTPSTTFAPTAPGIEQVLFAVDTWQGPWTAATPSGGGTYSGTTAALQNGIHILYAFAADGQHASSTSPSPNAGPLVGNIAAYVFLKATAGPSTATSTPAAGSILLGASNTDTVTVTGSATSGSPTGTVTFSVCGPLLSAVGCATGGAPVGSAANLTAGAGNTATASSAPFTAPAPGIYCFRADYGGDTNYLVSSDGSATECFTVTPTADLSITKTDFVTSAVPGSSSFYVITASNPGPSNAPGAIVADTLPASLTANWSCDGAGGGTCTHAGSGNINDPVDLPAGASVTYSVSTIIDAGATGTLSNTATITAPDGVTDPTLGNNSATDTDTLTPPADLSITKPDGATTATPGETVIYTITASNLGPSNATGATVADTFPATLTGVTWNCVGAGGGTCPMSGTGNINTTVNLPGGGNITYTATATVSAAATGNVSNTATVSAPDGVTDPTPGNNSATDTDTLSPKADLSVTKSGPATATPGSNVTYSISVTNNGPSNAPAHLSDALPAGTTFVSDAPGPWACTNPVVGANGTVTCDIASLAAGTTASLTITVHVGAAAAGPINNTGVVSTTATDPNSANNSSTWTTTAGCAGDHTITGSSGSRALSGGTWCVSGANVAGSLSVAAGTNVVITNSTIGGSVNASNPAGFSLCNSTVGSLSVNGSSGFVLVGDPGDDLCPGNTINGTVSLSNNGAGVEVSHDRIAGSLVLSGNAGGGPFADDVSPEVEANTVGGSLSCSSNAPAPTNDHQPNAVSGSRSGQCSGL